MLAVRGIYDGKTVKITEKITEKKKFRVVITFVEELTLEDNSLRDFSAQTSSMDFWNDSKEDIYQDYLNQKTE